MFPKEGQPSNLLRRLPIRRGAPEREKLRGSPRTFLLVRREMAPHPLLLRTSRPPAEPRGSTPASQLQLPPRSRAGCPPVLAPLETPRPGYDSRPGRTPPLRRSLSDLQR